MSIYQTHLDGNCWPPNCPACAEEDTERTVLYADDDADHNPTIWAQTGNDQPRAVLRLTALEPSHDREDHWERIVDALDAARKSNRRAV